MKITAITCTRDRPAAFKLAELYMSRQTIKPDQWIVLDDGETPVKTTMGQQHIYCPECRKGMSMINKLKIAFAGALITGDAVVFWEDDDYYFPTWLAECAKGLENAWIFGEGRAIYYNVRERWWFEHVNTDHASLCSTAIRKELFYQVKTLCDRTNHPFIDQELWRTTRGEKRRLRDPATHQNVHLTIGMKGLPGTLGYSGAHSARDKSAKDDLGTQRLMAFIGTDVSLYQEMWKDYQPPMNLRIPTHTETGRVHGPNWSRWLQHLAGKEGAAGLEIGTFKGESAEWMCENIFYGPKALYFCVDPFTGSVEHAKAGIDCTVLESESRTRLALFDAARIIKGYSENILREVIFVPLDFVYVDGDHTSRAALRDAVLAFDLMKVGGIMVFDDYEWNVFPRKEDCPRLGIDSFITAYADFLEVLKPRGWQVAVRKTK